MSFNNNLFPQFRNVSLFSIVIFVTLVIMFPGLLVVFLGVILFLILLGFAAFYRVFGKFPGREAFRNRQSPQDAQESTTYRTQNQSDQKKVNEDVGEYVSFKEIKDDK